MALACAVLASCAGLPEPDGTEAAILARAETLTPLTPDASGKVESIARNGLLLSPRVREAASQVSASADEVRVQRAVLFPSLSLSIGGGVGPAGNGAPGVALTGSQLLFDGGHSDRAVKVADFDLQIGYLEFQKSVDETLVETLTAYDEVRLQAELLNIYRKQLSALRELEALVSARVENGAVPATDRLESRRRMQSAVFLVNDTELALAEARDQLLLLTGQANGGRVSIAPGSCKAAGDSDALRIAVLREGRAELALTQAEQALVPRVMIQPVLRGQIGTSTLPVGVNFDVQSDLLQGGALTAKANVARNALDAARAQREVAKLDDDVAERGLQRAMSAAARKDEMLGRQIALLSETRELYRRQYFDMGTRQLSELLDNEEEFYLRQAERVELRSELARTHLDCAARSRSLRRALDLEGFTIYGYPLASDQL